MIHKGTIQIETERLILRRFVIEDTHSMFTNWASDPIVTHFLTWPAHESIEDTREILNDWILKYDRRNFYQWAIVCKDNNEPIGAISVVHYDDKVEMVDIAYCIGQKWWSQGYTSEALQGVVMFFFEVVKVNRIEACFDVRNLNSERVMKKCGLRYEGTKRQSEWNNQGLCDISEYAILAQDYFLKLYNSYES